MKPPTARIMPTCTTARGRPETLLRGRDGDTRSGPTTPRPTMGDAARAAATKLK